MEDFSYRIVKTKRKTIALRILPTGEVEMRCPLSTSANDIVRLLHKNAQWITKQRQKLIDTPHFHGKLSEGSRLFYIGKEYPLLFHAEKTFLWNQKAFLFPIKKQSNIRKILETWYKQQAKLLFTERALFYAKKHDFSYQKIRISSANRRYGSCSPTNHLTFTWKLIFLPLDLIDYVIVHELVHTQKKHHKKGFWQTVASILPDYKQKEKRLKETSFSAYWF